MPRLTLSPKLMLTLSLRPSQKQIQELRSTPELMLMPTPMPMLMLPLRLKPKLMVSGAGCLVAKNGATLVPLLRLDL